MKKTMVLLFAIALSIATLLSACERDKGNSDAYIDTGATTDQSNNTQNHDVIEMIAGRIQAIDGTNLTIDASGTFVANETGRHHSSGNSNEKQEINVRLTEQTIIEIRTSVGGQITGTSIGTLDDLLLQAIVSAEGTWDGDEFIAITIIIFKI